MDVRALHHALLHPDRLQLAGEKKMEFFPPGSLGVAAYPTEHPRMGMSFRGTSRGDDRNATGVYSHYRDTDTRRMAILRPGDALWLPSYWWHKVEVHGDALSFAINVWTGEPNASDGDLGDEITQMVNNVSYHMSHHKALRPGAKERPLPESGVAVRTARFLRRLLLVLFEHNAIYDDSDDSTAASCDSDATTAAQRAAAFLRHHLFAERCARAREARACVCAGW